jgi:hypothetical protein
MTAQRRVRRVPNPRPSRFGSAIDRRSRTRILGAIPVTCGQSPRRVLSTPVLARQRPPRHHLRVRVAQLSGASLVSFRGAGHLPNVRDLVMFKLLLLDFVDRVAA